MFENAFMFIFLVYFLHFINVFEGTWNIVCLKARKLKSLATLVRTQYKNIFMVIWVCTCIIAKNAYLTIAQKLNKSLVKIDKTTYELTYVINGIQYVLHIKVKKGPKTLIQALDKNDTDITEKIQAYLGPMENFHGQVFTPEFFGTDELTVSLSSGEDRTFHKDDQIVLI